MEKEINWYLVIAKLALEVDSLQEQLRYKDNINDMQYEELKKLRPETKLITDKLNKAELEIQKLTEALKTDESLIEEARHETVRD